MIKNPYQKDYQNELKQNRHGLLVTRTSYQGDFYVLPFDEQQKRRTGIFNVIWTIALWVIEQMGLQIKYARLRRKLPSELVAERAGISRATLVSIEKGSPSVAMGCYAAVLHALNYMDKDLLLVAKDDELGRKLQDLDLPVRKRAPRRG